MKKQKKITTIHGLSIMMAVACMSVAAQDVPAPLKFSKVVFQDNFDLYPVDGLLPTTGAWSDVALSRAGDCAAHIRTDSRNVFGKGELNQVLQVRDNDVNSPVRVIAEDINHLNSPLVRLSFDMVKVNNGLENSFSIKMGVGSVSSKTLDSVGGLQVEGPAVLRPARAGAYIPGVMCHVDVYFNETSATISYVGPTGSMSSLASGLMDVWVNGSIKGNDKSQHREVKELTPITSLRLETFTAAVQEVWFDNLEIAIPE